MTEKSDKTTGNAEIGDRQRLVATVAGRIAANIVVAPSKKTTTAAEIAEVAVDIAEEIVKRAAL